MVVAIIAIIATTATLSIGQTTSSRPLQKEAMRLASVAEYTADMAIFRNARFALRLDRDGYRVIHWHNREWIPVSEHRLSVPHELPQTIELSIANGRGGWHDKPERMITFDPEGTAEPIIIRLVDQTNLTERTINISATSIVTLNGAPKLG